MTPVKFLYFLSVVVVFLSFGCKKENPGPQLPPITTTGACTFGCRVNGEVWLPGKKSNGTLDDIEGGIVERYLNDGTIDTGNFDLLLFANQLNSRVIQLNLSRVNSTGDFFLSQPQLVFPMCTQCESYGYINMDGIAYTSLSIMESKVSLLRYDTLNQIFSGTFSFIGTSQFGKDSIKVTDGRFDIDMNKIN